MNQHSEYMDDLIAKVLAGEATREEVDQLEGWMNDAKENRLYFDETKKLFARIDSMKVEQQVNSAMAWEKLSARMDAGAPENTAKVVSLFSRKSVLRAAASLLVIAALGLVVNYVFDNTPETEPVILAAQQNVIEKQLPDGSKVTVNKHSEIAYVQKGNVREVKLKGEAFFEVVHDETRPFEINVDGIIIKDIGTAFNVKALPGSNTIEVVVESGEVQFYSASSEGLRLVKGEKALYNKTTKTFSKVTAGPAENTASYKSRIFQFQAIPLNEVIRQINDIYGSQISLAKPELGNCSLSVTFNDESLEGILEIITETLDMTVQKSGEQIILNGEPCTD